MSNDPTSDKISTTWLRVAGRGTARVHNEPPTGRLPMLSRKTLNVAKGRKTFDRLSVAVPGRYLGDLRPLLLDVSPDQWSSFEAEPG